MTEAAAYRRRKYALPAAEMPDVKTGMIVNEHPEHPYSDISTVYGLEGVACSVRYRGALAVLR